MNKAICIKSKDIRYIVGNTYEYKIKFGKVPFYEIHSDKTMFSCSIKIFNECFESVDNHRERKINIITNQ